MHTNREHVKPKLLVTTSTLPRSADDAEPRFVLDLSRALASKFDVTLLAPGFPGADAKSELAGLEVIHYRYAPLQSWETLAYPGGIMARLRAQPHKLLLVPCLVVGQALALRKLLRTRSFDLIHAHWLLPQGLLAASLPRGSRLSFVVSSHGGDVFIFGRGPLKKLLQLVMSRAAAITAVSTELVDACRMLGCSAAERVPLHYIPMGVDTRQFSLVAAGAPRPSDLPTKGPVLLFVGRMAEKKGVDVLLEAITHSRTSLAEAHIVLIGDGPLRRRWSATAVKAGLAKRVHFLGARDHTVLPAYLAAADLLVLPSVRASNGDQDGLPVTLLEAAACGLPAVASNIGGVPEFITDGENGMLVAPGDASALAAALGHLLEHPELRLALGTAARRRVEGYDWKTIAERYAKVLSEALPSGLTSSATPPKRPHSLSDEEARR
ncbi:MAG: glycosyltransferase [Pseudomonadota bacterium]